MSRIRFVDVSFAHVDAKPIFARARFDLTTGWNAVVGPNGAGKTTLIRLVTGELTPASGTVTIEPRGAILLHARQTPDAIDAPIAAFGGATDGAAWALRDELGLDPGSLDRWSTLSPGERRRWQLGTLLHRAPDVLLLDEPDGHLDREARAQLGRALARYRGVGVLVAHDRALVDAVASRTLWVEDGRVDVHAGGYTDARAVREAAHERAVVVRANEKRRAARLERELVERREATRRADRSVSAGSRMKGIHDGDARGALARGRAENAAKSRAKSTRSVATRVTRAHEAVARAVVKDALGRDVRFAAEPSGDRFAFRVALPRIERGGRLLVAAQTFAVARGARVRIAGPNGAGKSTLLGALRSAIGEDAGTFHLPQELDDEARASLLGRVRAMTGAARGRLLSLVAALGLAPTDVLASERPSPGEAKKLALAFALASTHRALVLDEPETHLDAPSVNRLEEALRAFTGAIVLVTHDDMFAARVTEETRRLEDGVLVCE